MEFCCSEVPMQVKESITRLKNKTNVAEIQKKKFNSGQIQISNLVQEKMHCPTQKHKKTKDDIMKFKMTKLFPRSRKTST